MWEYTVGSAASLGKQVQKNACRLPDVLAQDATIEVLHVLRPLIVVMAGTGELDPY